MGACQQLKEWPQKHTCKRLRTAAAAAGASSITGCLKVPSDEAAATAFCALACAMVTLDWTDCHRGRRHRNLSDQITSTGAASSSCRKPTTPWLCACTVRRLDSQGQMTVHRRTQFGNFVTPGFLIAQPGSYSVNIIQHQSSHNTTNQPSNKASTTSKNRRDQP